MLSTPESRRSATAGRTSHGSHAGESELPTTVIEVFADIACPFTHVGLRRFVEQRELLGRPDVRLLVRAWPLEVVNGQPLDPHVTAGRIRDIRDQVASDLFCGFTEATFPATSLPALALVSAAYAKDLQTGEDVSLELRELLFEHGSDITDPAVLKMVDALHDLDADLTDTSQVLADHAEGAARGVIGSPHFFTPSGDFFCPALKVAHDDTGQLAVSPDPDRFDRFLRSCFS